MMAEELYRLLALDSFHAGFVFSMASELSFFAMLSFDGYSKTLLVVFAMLGSMTGLVLNWLIGWGLVRMFSGLSLERKKGAFELFSQQAQRYGKWLLLFNWLQPFGVPITLLAGITQIRFTTFLLFTFASRLVFYCVFVLMG